MWETQLRLSKRLLVLYSLFYFGLILLLGHALLQTVWPMLTIIAITFGLIEFYRCYLGWRKMQGYFAIISDRKQIYFAKQRWIVYRPPLFLQYAIIVHVQAIRNNKRITLCLVFDHFSPADWRTFCYLLHRW